MAGRHVGFALKLHQRAWCLDRGITLLEWTYDPLVARNAYFNLGKLGARVAEYLPDFYGVMGDGINRYDESDRILVHWSLEDAVVVDACAGTPLRPVVPPGAAASWVAVPPRRRAAAAGRPRTSPELAPEGARTAHHRPGHRRPRRGIRQRARLPRAPGRRRSPVKLQGVELRRVAMPLVSPFRTSFGTQTARDILLLRAVTTSDRGDAEGWGECVAMSDPLYSSEYVDATADVLRRLPPARAGGVRRPAGPARCARGRVGAAQVQGPPDGQGRARDGRARRRAPDRGPVVGQGAGRRPRPRALGGVGGHLRQHPRSCSTPSTATWTRATSASS